MKSIKCYQFVSEAGQNFFPYFTRILEENGIPCFDFEDSFLGLAEIDKARLKQKQREQTLGFIQLNLPNGIMPAFRINSVFSEDFEYDLKFLKDVDMPFAVFIPKVENLESFHRHVLKLPNTVVSIIPIIETTIGFTNLEEICTYNDPRFKQFAFGHCDFNLDLDHFPFIHQDNDKYWSWIEALNSMAMINCKGFINSPFLELQNDFGFIKMIKRLKTFSAFKGQITLSLSQTRLLNQYSKFEKDLNLGVISEIKYSCPLNFIADFEKGKIQNRSFSITESGRLLSPQELQAAKNRI